VPTAQHGDVELFYEALGAAADPALLLINGLGSQCINDDEQWCEQFAAHGFRVIRFDNRDPGLSSKLDGREYTLRDVAGDALAVFDAMSIGRAHIMGLSMGGMIAQRHLATERVPHDDGSGGGRGVAGVPGGIDRVGQHRRRVPPCCERRGRCVHGAAGLARPA
jgi:pimeloyl-ACP methyl ester carboxylesterase